jgi:hypothetical protein
LVPPFREVGHRFEKMVGVHSTASVSGRVR